MRDGMKRTWIALGLLAAGCGGGEPKAKAPEAEPEVRRSSGPAPVVQQELGSIDERAVQSTFAKLQGQLAKCQTQGRDRVEYLAGDVKLLLRIDQGGRVRYGYLEESSLGDRETERCMLGVFSATHWPKPIGGEAEVRNAFGFDPGGERQPTPWGPEKVMNAIDGAKELKKDLEKCKATGVKITGYVVHDEGHKDHNKPKNGDRPGAKNHKDRRGGKFSAVGVSAPTKEAAEKVDCVLDAIKELRLPSPGSYAAKVSFTL